MKAKSQLTAGDKNRHTPHRRNAPKTIRKISVEPSVAKQLADVPIGGRALGHIRVTDTGPQVTSCLTKPSKIKAVMDFVNGL